MTALSTMPFLGNMVTLTLRRDIPIVIVYRIQREMDTAMGTAISCIFHRERSKISFGIGETKPFNIDIPMEHLVLTKQSAKIDMSAGIWSDGWLVRIFEDTVKCQIRMFKHPT